MEIGKITEPFIVFVATGIAIQLLGHYHANNILHWGHFYGFWSLLRVVIPVFLIWLAGISFYDAGFCLPSVNRNTIILIIFALLFFLFAFAGIYFCQGYFQYYAHSFGGSKDPVTRFSNFMIFTSSTLIGWEVLHRGFLLLGLSQILEKRNAVSRNTAIMVSIALVWIFETVFHFQKPELEAIAMFLGSPALSLLAVYTQSILLPLLMHFLVEILFILTLVMQSIS